YQCCHCPEHFYYRDLEKMEFGGRWIAEDCTWTRYGLKWDNSLQTNEAKSSSAYYQCCHCPEHFYYRDLEKMEFGGRWIAEDCTWTR
ncbi:hypothetical protein CQA18_27215, partial [Enterobacter hormaechei]